MKEGCEIVKVRDKRAATYRTLNTEKGKEEVQVKEYEAEYKNCDIEVIPEKYILRRWRRDLIPPTLRRNLNRYGEKNETIEKLTNEANFVVDECLFLLSKDEDKLAKFVEQLKNIKNEVQSQVPKPPSQKKLEIFLWDLKIFTPRIAAEQRAKDAAKDATKNDVAAKQPKRTDVVEEPTNAS
ncbi:hypothetical protein Tco_1124792 [Tanacetum coccineum]|uniref:Uncharacterized protein n=1 Tax=Tanacetum coccineum TaxID=301880 RepID=A0ABQ5J751_9ASTR